MTKEPDNPSEPAARPCCRLGRKRATLAKKMRIDDGGDVGWQDIPGEFAFFVGDITGCAVFNEPARHLRLACEMHEGLAARTVDAGPANVVLEQWHHPQLPVGGMETGPMPFF